MDSGAVRAAEVLCVAVLPFENSSGDPDSEYLSDGITETLINSLSQLGRLSVPARSTVCRYKGRTQEPLQVGRELGPTAVSNTQGNPYAVGYLGYAHGLAGHRAEAERALLQLKELAEHRYVPPLANAFVRLGLGQNDEVFK